MNRFISSLLLCAALAPAAVFAGSFEGKVSFRMTPARGEPQDISYSMKGDKVRIDMPGLRSATGGMIMDTTRQEMTDMMPQQKMYMTMPIPTASAASAPQQNSADG